MRKPFQEKREALMKEVLKINHLDPSKLKDQQAVSKYFNPVQKEFIKFSCGKKWLIELGSGEWYIFMIWKQINPHTFAEYQQRELVKLSQQIQQNKNEEKQKIP